MDREGKLCKHWSDDKPEYNSTSQTPFKKVAFLIVAVLLTIKLDAKIIVDAKFVEKF